MKNRKMFKSIAMLASALFITGCVSTKTIPIDMTKVRSSAPESVAISKREKPDFAAMTAGKAMFGAFGAMAMISAGNDLISENDVEDPASYIGSELASAFSKTIPGTVVKPSKAQTESTSPDELSEKYNFADYLIDVQTINWSLAYFPTDWDSYRVIYSAKLRVIDTRTQEQVAEGFCSRIPDQDSNSPSYDQLLNNNAKRLKKELKIAADACISEFKNNVLKVQS